MSDLAKWKVRLKELIKKLDDDEYEEFNLAEDLYDLVEEIGGEDEDFF